MPEIPNQLIDPELQPHDDGSNANGVGVSPQPLAVPYQPQQPPYALPPTSQPQWGQQPPPQWQQPIPPQQEWQSQYPPQQYQQPPQYPPLMPPPQMAPRKPKSRKRLWLIIGVVVIVLIVIGSIASQAGKGSQPTTTSQVTQPASTGQPQQPMAKPTQPSANTIGKAVQVGDTWVVTVNSVKTSQGTEFITPKSGDTFVVIDVTLKNISASVQHASGLIQWSLRDDSGQRMQVSLMGSDPGGTVTAGNLVRGQLSYEVPVNQHHFVLQFVPDFSGDVAEWNVTV
jgi:hypothetical protein